MFTSRGTVRTLSAETRDLAEASLKDIAPDTAAIFGGTAAVDYRRGYPVMVNSDAQTEFAAKAATSDAGA